MKQSNSTSVHKLWNEIYILMARKFPSTYHAGYWIDYEKLLIVRSLLSLASRVLQMIFGTMSGSAVW